MYEMCEKVYSWLPLYNNILLNDRVFISEEDDDRPIQYICYVSVLNLCVFLIAFSIRRSLLIIKTDWEEDENRRVQ